ncbi:hypothetical protein FMN63_05190 [Stappia sp. BW2]|uniref:hypothetical protein n=1 Tax=Stappia sp. BW2 TaxID=2592622 RepID=UPI0011DEA9A8|nr:hypothetical protein [Stappia sp. BW2]TYC75777.1 hypothetical protein FMN63_05190 [Stappia sp. BW2]
MNSYFIIILAIVLAVVFCAAFLGLSYLHSSILFGVVAVALSPVAIHRIPQSNLATGALVGLAIFASYPLKKFLHLDSFVLSILLTLACFAVLWVVGFGWKRSWK